MGEEFFLGQPEISFNCSVCRTFPSVHHRPALCRSSCSYTLSFLLTWGGVELPGPSITRRTHGCSLRPEKGWWTVRKEGSTERLSDGSTRGTFSSSLSYPFSPTDRLGSPSTGTFINNWWCNERQTVPLLCLFPFIQLFTGSNIDYSSFGYSSFSLYDYYLLTLYSLRTVVHSIRDKISIFPK